MGQKIEAPKKQAAKIPLHVYLGYLLIITLVFTAASFAKFAVSDGVADSAQVASFSVSALADGSQSVSFDDAGEKFGTSKNVNYEIRVSNADNGKVSAVAVGYKIIISFDASVITPDVIGSISVNSTTLSPSHQNGKYVYTYTAATPLPAGVETTLTHNLSVAISSKNVTDDYSNIPISVSVVFEQID